MCTLIGHSNTPHCFYTPWAPCIRIRIIEKLHVEYHGGWGTWRRCTQQDKRSCPQGAWGRISVDSWVHLFFFSIDSKDPVSKRKGIEKFTMVINSGKESLAAYQVPAPSENQAKDTPKTRQLPVTLLSGFLVRGRPGSLPLRGVLLMSDIGKWKDDSPTAHSEVPRPWTAHCCHRKWHEPVSVLLLLFDIWDGRPFDWHSVFYY